MCEDKEQDHVNNMKGQCVCVCLYPFDVASLRGRASQTQPDHVHQETWDPQQVHSVPDERRRNDVVHKKRSIIRKEDAPEISH